MVHSLEGKGAPKSRRALHTRVASERASNRAHFRREHRAVDALAAEGRWADAWAVVASPGLSRLPTWDLDDLRAALLSHLDELPAPFRLLELEECLYAPCCTAGGATGAGPGCPSPPRRTPSASP